MMRKTRILSGLLAAALLVAFSACGCAEWKEETRNNKVFQRTWVDENGKEVPAPEGYSTVKMSYSGTTVTEKYYDPAGNPVKAIGGYYGRMLTYGNRHRLEKIVYIDKNGDMTDSTAGFARVSIGYTAAGKVTVTGYYDSTNHPVMVPYLGYAQVKNDYRGTTLTKTTYLDEDRNPIDSPLGYAVLVQSVNQNNKVTGIRFEHANGTPAACPEGWATMKRDLDKKNREVSVKYYDLSGKMTDRGLGYAYEVKTWENDQTYRLSRYNAQDQQVQVSAGVASLRREINRDGLVIKETCLDENGSAREDAEGVAARKYQYDAKGRLVRVTFESARGEAAENLAGYAGYSETLDADGFVLSRTFLGKGGKAVNTTAGYSEIRYLYDEMRQVKGTEYYDVNGVLVRQE